MNAFWSWFVIGVTVLNLVGLVWLLMATARRRQPGEAETTGHVWDGDVTELNNPLPLWWLGLFVLTVIFAVGYLVLYPGMGALRGTLGWNSQREVSEHVAATNARLDKLFAQFRQRPLEELAKDPDALKIGHNVFVNNCAACHGSDARGAKGFPNLADKDWLYGGDAQTVLTSIRNGRNGAMPAWGKKLGTDRVKLVAAWVLSQSETPAATSERARTP